MKKAEFLLLLDELMELPQGTLKGPEKLVSLAQWDSLASVGFIALVDRHLGMAVDPGKLAEAATVDDLLALVKEKLQ
ncbi:MAG: acyl carrier protein [Verrucomicrobia bacterium]|nr:acyl carrier protein [Verrucomicrobiota bacterium]